MKLCYLRKMISQVGFGKIINWDGRGTLPSIKYSLIKINPVTAFFLSCCYMLDVSPGTYIQIFNIHRVNDTVINTLYTSG